MYLSPHLLSTVYYTSLLFIAFIMVHTIKGFGRALGCSLAGDTSARDEGYFTLNPLAHIDFASFIVCIAFILGVETFIYHIRVSELLLLFILFGFRSTFPFVFDARHARPSAIISVVFFPFLLHLMTAFFCGGSLLLIAKYQKMCGYPILRSLVDVVDSLMNMSLIVGVLEMIPLPPFQAGYLLHLINSTKAEEWTTFLEENSSLVLIFLFVIPFVSELFLSPVFIFCDFLKAIIFRSVGFFA